MKKSIFNMRGNESGIRRSDRILSEEEWARLDRKVSCRAMNTKGDDDALVVIATSARMILKKYSSSFYIVTRFLPAPKRERVECIYTAVRYPDEIVDTFPLASHERIARLDAWASSYDDAIRIGSIRNSLAAGIPCFATGMAHVVSEHGIPPEYYHLFLNAMKRDALPSPFETVDELINEYVFGSAIVVGYFLAYVYGPSSPGQFGAALEASRSLGIALQLTNFVRDVYDDEKRGRCYLPLSFWREEGIVPDGHFVQNFLQQSKRVTDRLASVATYYYDEAERNLDAFAPDCRTAIHACIRVYRQLNEQVLGAPPDSLLVRQSVPLWKKFKVLPVSKYWKVSLAFLGGH